MGEQRYTVVEFKVLLKNKWLWLKIFIEKKWLCSVNFLWEEGVICSISSISALLQIRFLLYDAEEGIVLSGQVRGQTEVEILK